MKEDLDRAGADASDTISAARSPCDAELRTLVAKMQIETDLQQGLFDARNAERYGPELA